MRTDHRPHTSHRKSEHYSGSQRLDETSNAFEGIRLALHYLPAPDAKAKMNRQQRSDLVQAIRLLTRISMSAPKPAWVPSSDLVNG